MRERFWGAYKLELRQVYRQWSYWLIQVALIAFILNAFASGGEFYTAQELLWAGASRNVIGTSSLLVLLFGAFGAGRARRNRMDVLEATLPTGAEIPLARWAALITASLPFLLSALIISLLAGPFESFLRGLPVFLLESTLTLVFTASLVWLIEVTVGIRRWMYPVMALLWVAAIFVTPLSTVPLFAPWAGQWNFTRFGYGGFTDAWGRLAQGAFPWLLNWFYLGMIVLLVGLIVRAADRRRFYQTTGLVRGVVGTGALVAAAGYGLYGLNFMQTIVQTDSPFSATPMIVSSFDPNQPAYYNPSALPYAITRYEIALDLASQPTFDVTLDVINRGDELIETIDVTLNENAEILDISKTYTREGAYVEINLDEPLAPNETISIALQYTGEMRTYQYIWGAPPELETFITPDGILLKHNMYWYPRAGHIPKGMGNRIIDEPSKFTLRVTGTDMPLASNLSTTGENTFESAGTPWATLIGAPLLEIQEPAEGVNLITTAHQYDRLEEYMETGFQGLREQVAQYFPADTAIILTHPRWYFTVTPSIYEPVPMVDRGVVISRPPPSSNYASSYWFYEQGVFLPAQHFFGDTSMTTMLTENVAQFVNLQILHNSDIDMMRIGLEARMIDHHGRPIMADEEDELLYAGPGFAFNYAITGKLIDVYEAHGTEGVKLLLNAMREEAAVLKVTVAREVVAWIDAWVAENLADA